MTGFVVSVTFTVTVKDAVPEGLPRESVAEQLTVVTPPLKLLPELGEQLVGTPSPSTMSLAVGPAQVTVAGGELVVTAWSPGMLLRVGPVVS